MTISNCSYCGVEITPELQSREHIIQNAIGGRKEVPNVFCRPCNSTFGDRWDSEAAEQLHFLSLKLQVVRDDGEVPARYYQTISGRRARLHLDGHMTFPPQKPEITEMDGKVHIQITAPDTREAKKALKGQKRHYPKVDLEAGEKAMVYQETYLEEPINVTFELAGDGPYRSVVKSALTLAVSAGIRGQECEHALQYLRPNGEYCFGSYYRRDLIVNRPADGVFHCVAVKGDPNTRKIIGYVELFSIYRFVICLSENYIGPLVEDSYSIDPTTGKTIDLNFNLDFSEEEFRLAVDDRDETVVAGRFAAAHRVMALIQQLTFEREQQRVAGKVYKETLETLKLEPGQEMTPEIAMAMSKEMTAKMLPFLKHRLSAQLGGKVFIAPPKGFPPRNE